MTSSASSIRVSVTAMEMLGRCPVQFERRYLRGEVLPPGVALLVGSAVDRSVTTNLRRKVAGEDLLPLEAVADVARDELAQRWAASEIVFSDDELEEGPAKVRGAAVDKSVRLATLHARELAPQIEPTHIQRGFELDLAPGYPAVVRGYLDIQEGRRRIRDTKTAAKTPGKDEADKSLQLSVYALAAKVLDGEIPETVQLDTLVDLKKEPKVEVRESRRDEASFAPVLRRIERFIETVERGVFHPANPDGPNGWACSRGYCGYWNTCPYALRPVSVAVPSNGGE